MRLAATPRAPEVISHTDLAELESRLTSWLHTQALPLWYSLGADHGGGGFFEMLDQTGRAVSAPRRARVQPRQVHVFSQASHHGWPGPSHAAAQHGLEYLQRIYRRGDGLYRTLSGPNGEALSEQATVYDQAFALLAFASISEEALALDLLDCLQSRRHVAGGFREDAFEPFQSNPHMHLFEASLAWVEAEGLPIWSVFADELAALALTYFIDGEHGFVREFFDEDWRPANGKPGRRIEPGHQFEWAWLLVRWSRLSGDKRGIAAAQRLFECGLKGVDEARGVAVDALYDDYSIMEDQARLWPQAEWLKAALVLNKPELALRAAQALSAYLKTPVGGLWRDKMKPDGSFVEEAAPASSLYHIASAIWELASHVSSAPPPRMHS
jgi:mannose/cellobiose epimerase-like protein (N-acyl-D-glucosamine 2-epimerase family)